MATNVSISSNASLLLGGGTINSFDESDDNDVAKLAINLYDSTRDALLRDHTWNCCKKRVALAPDATAPAFDYSYQYSLPADWLRTVQIGEMGCPIDYVMEGKTILCDDNPLYLVYVFQNTNEATWEPSLVRAMELSMKAAMAYGITKSTSVKQAADQELAMFLKRARAIDGQDEPAQTFGDERLYGAAFRNGY